MKPKTTLLSAIWLISFALACVIGAKVNSSKLEKTATENSTEVSSSLGSKSTHAQRKSSARRNISSGKQDPQAEFTSIIEIQDSAERTTRLLALIKTLGPEGLQQVATAFYTSGLAYQRLTEYDMVINAWVKADPLGILDQIAKHRHRGIITPRKILASWAEYDPDAALHWVKNNKHRNGKEYPLAGIIRGIAVSDLQRATEIFHTIQNSTDRHYSLLAIIPYIAKQGPNQANEWVKNIKDQEFRSKAAKEIIKLLTRQDPKTAAQWALSENRALIPAVAGEWAKSDLTSAIAWTESLQNYEKDTAAESIIAEYSIQDLEQASQWINNFTESSTYSSIVDQFAKTAFFSNRPELALSKIATIKNTSKHNRSQKYILSRWYSKNPTAAAVWMDNQNISHKTREKVISHSKAYP